MEDNEIVEMITRIRKDQEVERQRQALGPWVERIEALEQNQRPVAGINQSGVLSFFATHKPKIERFVRSIQIIKRPWSTWWGKLVGILGLLSSVITIYMAGEHYRWWAYLHQHGLF